MLDFFVTFPTAYKLENVEKTVFWAQEDFVHIFAKRGDHLKQFFGKFDRSFGMHAGKSNIRQNMVNFDTINISLECEAGKWDFWLQNAKLRVLQVKWSPKEAFLTT